MIDSDKLERMRLCHFNIGLLSQHLPVGTEENCGQDNRPPGWDLELGPPKYEAAQFSSYFHFLLTRLENVMRKGYIID
jgi:hypothetical protein